MSGPLSSSQSVPETIVLMALQRSEMSRIRLNGAVFGKSMFFHVATGRGLQVFDLVLQGGCVDQSVREEGFAVMPFC